MEFFALARQEPIEGSFNEFWETTSFKDLPAGLLYASDGEAFVKTVVSPSRRATLDLHLTEPFTGQSDLYLFARSATPSVAFGWCRWHRLGMLIDPRKILELSRK